MRKLSTTLLCVIAAGSIARAERPRVFAITGAQVIVAPGQRIDSGTIVLRDGLIEAAGKGITAPADAYVIDAAGKTVTAGFIDACTDLGQKKTEAPGGPPGAGGGPSAAPREPAAGAAYPIARIHPERRAVDLLTPDTAAFEKHRGMGFTTAVTMPGEGIFRGEAAMIDLGDPPLSNLVVRESAGQMIALEHGGGQGYPSSLMGSIAAIRQALLDAQRHAVWMTRYHADPAGMPRPDYLAAFAPLIEVSTGRDRAIFDVKDSADLSRAISIAKEFSLNTVLVASGAETVQVGAVSALKSSGYPVILPLAYPDKPKVDDPDEALNVTLRDLERWDAAPSVAGSLQQAGIPLALGTCRMTTVGDFPANLRKAVGQGLKADAALAALTTSPAKFFSAEKSLGTVEAGKIANLVVFDGASGDEGVFAEKAKPVMVFVDGVRYDIEQKKSKGDPNAKVDPRGTWSVTLGVGGRTFDRTWTIKGKEGDYGGTAETQAGLVGFVSVKLVGNEMTVVLPAQGGRPSQEIVVVITGESFEGGGESTGGGAALTAKGHRTAGPEGGGL